MTNRPGKRGRSKFARHLLAGAVTLSMGYVFGLFALGGCGGSQAGFAAPADGQLSERVVERLTDCGRRGPTPLQPVKHTIAFDVFMDSDGQVEQVALRDSTLHLDEVEACMARVLYASSERAMDASLRRREPASPASRSPETRAGKGVRKEKAGASAYRGPCEGRGGFHTNVRRGKDYIASIVGCNCCDDSSGKVAEEHKATIIY